jgi:hypothetical protein
VCVCVLNFYDFIIPKFKPFVRSPPFASSLLRHRAGAKEKSLRDSTQPCRLFSGGVLGVWLRSQVGWLLSDFVVALMGRLEKFVMGGSRRRSNGNRFSIATAHTTQLFDMFGSAPLTSLM